MFIATFLVLQLVIGVIIENIEMQKTIEEAPVSQSQIQVKLPECVIWKKILLEDMDLGISIRL